MSWGEFTALLAGLSPDTALGRVVAIRTETDDNVIKHFTSDQKKIYDGWRDRKAKAMSEATYNDEMAKLEAIFASMFGGGGGN